MTVSPASLPKTQLSDEALGLDRYSFLKRAVDLTMALFALVVLMPLMLLIALAIRLDSPGPVFYSQERVGLNRRRGSARTARGSQEPLLSRFGRPFKIYKFRSMVSDAEAGTGAVWATREDPRVTRLGRLLRRTHLDELPQFFNVVRGDMSIVGPRPERPEIVEHLAVPEFRTTRTGSPYCRGSRDSLRSNIPTTTVSRPPLASSSSTSTTSGAAARCSISS
jgi:lipopolysaccharide/colanic/teichoic acid biosynthesis glycosyltransferase